MAVQKSKVSRARRGARRSHNALKNKQLSVDPVTGEKHLRHHMARDGFYKKKNLPYVFGKVDPYSFIEFVKIIKKSKFDLNTVKEFYFFPSERWDIKTKEEQSEEDTT